MNVEMMVRDSLRTNAGEASTSGGLLDAVHTRSRLRRRRRRVRQAGMAISAGAAAGLLAMSIPYGASIDGPTVPESGPLPVALAPPSFELPSFPLTPGWTPDGLEPPYVSLSSYFADAEVVAPNGAAERLERTIPDLRLNHPPRPEEISPPLIVEIYSAGSTPLFEVPDGRPITVLDRPGTRYVGEEGNAFIIWQHEPDQWVRVWAEADIAPADVDRYAQELEETPLTAEAPFTFDLLPVGAAVTGVDADDMSFEAGDGVRLKVTVSWNERTVGPIIISPPPTADPPTEPSPSAAPAEPSPTVFPSGAPPEQTQVEVGGRPAELIEWSDGTSVEIYLEQDWVLSVSGTLNREDLLRVAEGIDLTPLARPFGEPSGPQ